MVEIKNINTKDLSKTLEALADTTYTHVNGNPKYLRLCFSENGSKSYETDYFGNILRER